MDKNNIKIQWRMDRGDGTEDVGEALYADVTAGEAQMLLTMVGTIMRRLPVSLIDTDDDGTVGERL